MIPNLQTLVGSHYKGRDRAVGFGVVGAISAVGAAVGPIAGGYLTTYHSWRWAFRLEVVVVVLVLVLSRYLRRDEARDERPGFDFVGALLSAGGWTSIVLGFLLVQDYGLWTARKPLIIGELEIAPFGLSIVPFLLAAGVLLVMLLFRWERRLEERGGDGLFRPSLLATPGLVPGISVRFVQMAMAAAFLFTLPLLFQLSFEFTAMETGIALIPFSLAVLVMALSGARLAARYTAKRLIQAGYVLAILGLASIAATIEPDVQPADIAVGVVFGLGLGLISALALNYVLSSVDESDAPETAGINGTFEQLGNSIGVALVGSLMIATLNTGLEQAVLQSPQIPVEVKADVTSAAAADIQLMSDTQVADALETAGVGAEAQREISDAYAFERTRAFQSGLVFLMMLAAGGLVLTLGMTNRRLVEA
jgi:MFS family permease